MRDSCIFYRSFYEAIKDLSLEQQAIIYNAIFSYSLDFTVPELSGICKSIFTLIKPQIDANLKRYNNGLTPKQKQTDTIKKAKRKQTKSKTEANVNVNVNDNENKNINENNKIGEFLKVLSPLELKFNEFLKFRKEMKKPVLDSSIDALKEKIWQLAGKNEKTAIEIINQSIANGWQGVFELKTTSPAATPQTSSKPRLLTLDDIEPPMK